jgi:hypothetical protein
VKGGGVRFVDQSSGSLFAQLLASGWRVEDRLAASLMSCAILRASVLVNDSLRVVFVVRCVMR